jgi:hypothetical protein
MPSFASMRSAAEGADRCAAPLCLRQRREITIRGPGSFPRAIFTVMALIVNVGWWPLTMSKRSRVVQHVFELVVHGADRRHHSARISGEQHRQRELWDVLKEHCDPVTRLEPL